MKNKKIYLLALLLLVCILSISTISATENTTNENVISADNNQENNLEINNQYEDVSNSKENDELNIEETNNEEQGSSGTDKVTTVNEDPLSFTELNTTINNNTNPIINLTNNYKYNKDSDTNFQEGIIINRDLTIYGNGFTLDGNKIARIFKVDENVTVEFHNINFINGKSHYGGAIWGGNSYNCTFTGNRAIKDEGVYDSGDGGAIFQGNAYNCTFTKNKADSNGGAINIGNAYDCIFTQNKANEYGGAIYSAPDIFTEAYYCTFTNNTAEDQGGAIYGGNAYNCNFTENKADKDGGAMQSSNATNCIFTENIANKYGGAIYYGNAYNCTFQNNSAGKNGGALNQANASYCTFTGNKADDKGGAIDHGNAYNCTFDENQADNNGGAIYYGNAYNCTFQNNSAGENGGALNQVNAYVCTFKDNNATNGEAMYKGTACLCIFNEDSTKDTIIIPATLNALNYTSTYKSGEKLIFNLTAKDIVLDGFNITINIYKDGQLCTTVYGLSGEGWIVDLAPGEYIAELSLPLYPEVTPINATISVSKGNTTVVIDPIIDVIVGKEITINYTTNSNGTVTIEVNGEIIPDGKFTPPTSGIYNVTIIVAENDYYTSATNQTTFTAEKLTSIITANPVTTTYNIGKNLIITLKDANNNPISGVVLTVNLGSAKQYKTDKNGQIIIDIAKLTPKTYNAKITYSGSDIYNGSTKSVKVTVKKAKPKITAKSASYKLKVKTKKYLVIFKDNKNKGLKNTKVTLKIYGKTYTTKTNSKGQATFKITNLKKKGRYTALITVPANKYYNKVSKKVKITVKL